MQKSKLRVGLFDKQQSHKSVWLGVRELLAFVVNTVEQLSVPLAPSPTFPSPLMDGAVVVHVDASRNLGCGGWGWQKESRGWTLWAFSTPWPPWVVEALRVGDDRLSMPAGELVGVMFAKCMAETAMAATAVIVVSDCQPVVGAVNSHASPSPQLHELLRSLFASRPSTQCLAVHVKREYNQLADDLSNLQFHTVEALAARCEAPLRRWLVPERHTVWTDLATALAMPQGL